MSEEKILQNAQSSENRASENIIINGDFRIAQRGTSFVAAADKDYVADRFRYVKVGAGVATLTRQFFENSDVPFSYYAILDVTTADATVDATDYQRIQYFVEGSDMENLNFGLSSAKTITLSFWHQHKKTGIYSVSFRNHTGDRSYVAEYTQAVTNVWEYSTIIIPGDTTGTWEKGNLRGVAIDFGFMVGSTFQTTPGSWTAGNFFGSTNLVNGFDNVTNIMRIGNVKLEEGNVATPFVSRSFAEELALCQRYYEKSYPQEITPGTANQAGEWTGINPGGVASFGGFMVTVPFKVRKRSGPTNTIYSTQTGAVNNVRVNQSSDSSSYSLTAISTTTFQLWNGGATPNTGDYLQFQWTASSEL